MNSLQSNEPMETSIQKDSHPSVQMLSSEDPELDSVVSQRKTRENYKESVPELAKPRETVEDVPEQEEIKLSPRKEQVE